MIKSSLRAGNMMIAIAWFAILVSSDIPHGLVARLFFISSITPTSELWADIVKVVMIGLLAVIVSFRPDLHPIRGFLVALSHFRLAIFLFIYLKQASIGYISALLP